MFLLGVVRTIIAAVRLASDWLTQRSRGAGERLRHVLAMKKEVSEHFPEVLPPQTDGDAIIRELRRKDTYPKFDDRLRGISPWFKVELKGTYYRGVEVFLSVQKALVDDGVARPAYDTDDAQAQTVFEVGRIPYGAIEGIDWEGDEFYGFTHIYCRFRGWAVRKGPYESVELYERDQRSLGGGRKHYHHLEGVRWKPRRRMLIGRWWDRRTLRKAEREVAR